MPVKTSLLPRISVNRPVTVTMCLIALLVVPQAVEVAPSGPAPTGPRCVKPVKNRQTQKSILNGVMGIQVLEQKISQALTASNSEKQKETNASQRYVAPNPACVAPRIN